MDVTAGAQVNPWADESHTLEEALDASDQPESSADWKRCYLRKMEGLGGHVRTIVLVPLPDSSPNHIDGLLQAVEEKLKQSGNDGRPVSIRLAVEDEELYESIARRLDAANEGFSMQPIALTSEREVGVRMSAVKLGQYDELLELVRMRIEDGEAPIRAVFEHRGMERRTTLYKRTRSQFFCELIDINRGAAKRERDTRYALAHALEPILHEVEAKGMDGTTLSRRESFLDALLGQATKTQNAEADRANETKDSTLAPFARVPDGSSVAPSGKLALEYIANTVILGSGTIPAPRPKASRELRDAVDAFNDAWETPWKIEERILQEARPDNTSGSSGKSIKWWKVACEDDLRHIEQLHVVLQDAESRQPWPNTREGFKALYLAMFDKLKGSVALEPIMDLNDGKDSKDGKAKDASHGIRSKCSQANLEGLLDAIDERTRPRQRSGLPETPVGEPPLSIVVTMPEDDTRNALLQAVNKRKAPQKDSAPARDDGETKRVRSSKRSAAPRRSAAETPSADSVLLADEEPNESELESGRGRKHAGRDPHLTDLEK